MYLVCPHDNLPRAKPEDMAQSTSVAGGLVSTQSILVDGPQTELNIRRFAWPGIAWHRKEKPGTVNMVFFNIYLTCRSEKSNCYNLARFIGIASAAWPWSTIDIFLPKLIFFCSLSSVYPSIQRVLIIIRYSSFVSHLFVLSTCCCLPLAFPSVGRRKIPRICHCRCGLAVDWKSGREKTDALQ